MWNTVEVRKNLLSTTQGFSSQTLVSAGMVMVWGRKSWRGVATLEFIDGIMIKEESLNLLARNLDHSATKLRMGCSCTFQQDENPKHTTKIITDWLRDNTIDVFSGFHNLSIFNRSITYGHIWKIGWPNGNLQMCRLSKPLPQMNGENLTRMLPKDCRVNAKKNPGRNCS